MIYAVYAVGMNGEFGLDGKLPWGSFPEELKCLKSTLGTNKISGVLVGIKTWENLPKSFRSYIQSDLDAEVLLYAPRKDIRSLDHGLVVVTHLDYSFKEYAENINLAIIGGATLLVDATNAGIIDGAYISYVWNLDNSPMEADVYLPGSLFSPDEMPPATTFLSATGSNEKLAFAQEYCYYGTV